MFVAPAAQGSVLSPSSAGNIFGFAKTDAIDMIGVAGATHAVWSQNLIQQLLGWGQVELLNSHNTEIGAISLYGAYKTSDFAVASDGHGGTIIGHT